MFKSILRLSVVAAFLAMAGGANAGFIGAFDLSNWTFANSPGSNDGFVNLYGSAAFTLNGGDNHTALGTSDFTIVMPSSGEVSFQWFYLTEDYLTHWECNAIPGDYCDPAYVLVNGAETQLSFSQADWGYEAISLSVGDVFGFRVKTADGDYGRGRLTVLNFDFSPSGAEVPEPSTIALYGLGLVVLGFARRRRA